MSSQKEKKLLDEVRDAIRLKHYSIHTERTYCDWIKRYVLFHEMRSRDDLCNGEQKIEQFLTHLAVNTQIAAATQNQAMNALVFLYRKVLKLPLDNKINAIRAKRKVNIPVVMSREEVRAVIEIMGGVPQLIVKILYGSGLRISEAVRLRVQDVDYDMQHIIVRSGKGAKDRVTTFAASIIPFLEEHLSRVKAIHVQDISEGFGRVYLPDALSRKYRGAEKDWNWQYMFPSGRLSRDPRSGMLRRHHIDPGSVNRAIKRASIKAGLKNGSAPIPSAIVLRRICWKKARISERFKPCSDIRMFLRR